MQMAEKSKEATSSKFNSIWNYRLSVKCFINACCFDALSPRYSREEKTLRLIFKKTQYTKCACTMYTLSGSRQYIYMYTHTYTHNFV